MRMKLISLIGTLSVVALVVTACGGSDSSTAEAPTVDATLRAGAAPECFPKDDTIHTSTGGILRLECREAAIGERVRVTATNWNHENPLQFFLLTEEQSKLGFAELKEADIVELGEVPVTDGEAYFDLVLASSYETVKGNKLDVAPGGRLCVFAFQYRNGASVGHGTCSLMVR